MVDESDVLDGIESKGVTWSSGGGSLSVDGEAQLELLGD